MNFIIYYLSRITSILGNTLQGAIIPIVILDQTNSGKALGDILGYQQGLLIIVSIFSGKIADLFNRKYIMIICDVLNVLFLGIYLFFFKGSINWLIALILIQNSIGRIFNSASSTIFSQLVSQNNLLKRRALMDTSIRVINVASPAIGIFLYTKLGLTFILAFNLTTFGLSIFLELFLKYKSHLDVLKKSSRKKKKISYKIAMNFIKESDVLFKKILIFGLAVNFLINPFISIIIPYTVKSYLNLSSIYLGYLMSAFTLGATLGGVYLSKYGHRISIYNKEWFLSLKINILTLFSICFLWYLLKLEITLVKPLLIITFFIQGTTNIIYSQPIFNYFEINIPHEIKGRAFSLIDIAMTLLVPISFFLTSSIIDKVNPLLLSLSLIILESIFCFLFFTKKKNSLLQKDYLYEQNK